MNFEEMSQMFHAEIEFNQFFIDGRLYTLSHFKDAVLVSIEQSFFPKETVRFIGQIPWEVSHYLKIRGKIRNLIFDGNWKPTYKVYWKCAGPIQFSYTQFKQILKDHLINKPRSN
mgnify:CR=1 FL=1